MTELGNVRNYEDQKISEVWSGEDYAKTVETWAIYGYHPRLIISGKEYPKSTGFYSGGKDSELIKNNTNSSVMAFDLIAAYSVSSLRTSYLEAKFKNIVNHTLVSVTNPVSETDPKYLGKKLILLGIFHDTRKMMHGRAGAEETAGVIALLVPAEVGDRFQEDLRKNPDLLKDFYKKTLPGMDSQGGEDGLDRHSSVGIIYISEEKLRETAQGGQDPAQKIDVRIGEDLSKFLSGCEEISFRNGSMR